MVIVKKVPWRQSNVFKISVSWAVLVVLGLGSFVVARKDINGRRREIMMSKKRMAQIPVKEIEEDKSTQINSPQINSPQINSPQINSESVMTE